MLDDPSGPECANLFWSAGVGDGLRLRRSGGISGTIEIEYKVDKINYWRKLGVKKWI